LNSKVLFILLDAFRHDYINAVDTPFLYAKTRAGIYAKKLKSTTGFTQRTAIYTGTSGIDSGMFTMFTFDPDGSPFRFVTNDRRLQRYERKKALLSRIPARPGLRRVRRLLKARLEREERGHRQWIEEGAKRYAAHAPSAHIPLRLLPHIGVSEDNQPIYLPGAFPQQTIFDVFAAAGIRYKYLMFPVVNCEDAAVLQMFIKGKDSDAKILLGQFSDSDLLIHQCGPGSPKRREIAAEIDRRLREIAAAYDDGTTWIIIGDHGMTDVTEELDIPESLAALENECGAAIGRDYWMFLDSTMARFRWITDRGRRFVFEISGLSILRDKGRFIDERMSSEYFIPVHDRRYGDLIWWANNGILLFPDYFHDDYTHNKGMHGYDSNHPDMKGFLLAFGPGIAPNVIQETNLIDVCPTICAAVGVPPPRENKGDCLLRRR
jgi:predicted AlkP superfamily pyrophosphatase or phosphodiesterase